MRVVCRPARTTLAASVLDRGRVPAPLVGHVTHCLACQAVVANSRRLRRDLSSLTGVPMDPTSDPPFGLGWAVAGAAVLTVVMLRLRPRPEGPGRGLS